MPEKIHTKFGGAPGSNALSETHNQPKEKPEMVPIVRQKSTTPDNAKINGIKRLRDGSPKLGQTPKPPKREDLKQSAKPSAAPKGLSTDFKAQSKSTPINGVVSNIQEAHRIAQKVALAKGPIVRSRQAQKLTSNANRNSTQERSNLQHLRKVATQLEKARKDLPIWAKKIDIRWTLRHNDVLLLNGETGSGKSTQVPQFLCTEPWCQKQIVKIKGQNGEEEAIPVGGMIVITQPRRVAAITLAHRVAREMGSPLIKGARGEVGYSVRFDTTVPLGAKIKFVTEGMLLQEMLHDPNLRKYSAVIVDEIHERSVDVDLLAGFLRQIIHGDKKGRGGIPLKLVVMSATLDLGGIEAFFAKPGTQPKYQPGNNHGKVLAAHLLGPSAGGAVESDQSRPSSDESFSSWGGISNSGDESNHSISSIPNPEKPSSASKSGIKPLTKGGEPLPNEAHYGVSENGVAVEYVQGRQHEVNIFYEVKPAPDYLHNALQTILQLHIKEPLPGDILAFLSGQEEIETLQTQLEGYAENLVKTLPRMKVMPLHGSLPAQAQQDVFEKVKEHFTRKIVLATNIAETSVTVSGVRFVVDCGKAKVKQYRPRLGMESLLAKPISRVSAIQRAGRAGREAKGKCFRVYTEQDYLQLEQDDLPEILRSDVIEAVLKMKARGVIDVLTFPLMDSPNIVAMERALLQLHMMGALDDCGNLTNAGKKMASYPLPAALGRVLIAATELDIDVLLEVIDIISCLTTDSEIFLQPKSEEERDDIEIARRDILDRQGDILTLLNTMRKYAAENTDRTGWCRQHLVSIRAMKMALAIRKQLRQLCFQQKLLKCLPPPDPLPVESIAPERVEYILKAFLKAFGTRTALLAPDGTYVTVVGRNAISIHPSSVLYGKKVEAIVFLDHVFTSKSYARKVSVIQADWITQVLEYSN
ncbi:P-loop containing nucleoside triphosphate hydrolase protein [Stipitochalara longipes BDJ]|nr:P-loop containing nucleoside triphosphate hydrolase protein [Stipitochalara longipes BDJ]